MAATEHVIFQTYAWKKIGSRSILQPGTAVACRNSEDALRRLEKAKDGLLNVAGAQAVRMSVDEEAGDYGEPEVLGSVGETPLEEM